MRKEFKKDAELLYNVKQRIDVELVFVKNDNIKKKEIKLNSVKAIFKNKLYSSRLRHHLVKFGKNHL